MHALQINRRPITTTSGSTTTGSRWRRLPFWLPLALVLVGWSATTTAEEYAIQVGAFKTPNQDYADNLRSYGEVNTAQSNGVTVFTVGRYNTLAAAKDDLNRIAADYPGAFVRNLPSAASTSARPNANTAKTAAPRKGAAQKNSKTPDTQLWESLSESERRRVVYLDGVLHLKQGDQFVPLAEYRRGQTQ